MIKDNIKITQCQRYKYPHGAVYIGPSDATVSCGYLELAPDRATNKIMRALPEHVKQIEGVSEIEIFDEDNKITIKRLEPGNTFLIPTSALHVHRNRGVVKSINYWEYQGNATTFIDQIKKHGILDKTHALKSRTSTNNTSSK